MAYYAFLDENNIVTEVITGIDETELIEGLSPEVWYGNFRGQTCVRTSYNSSGGEHRMGKANLRKNFAGVGMIYDPIRDAFIAPKPFNSWVLDEAKGKWKAPIPEPHDGKQHKWEESEITWVAEGEI